ncbi:hypothetical protein SAMN06265375_10161 [Muriicola jejuensis]|uniref:Uncharacterized protein n=1 Tax=Muriicola jejuensis TaxID=504488 RepID=A0A6P0UAZ8_9FLAO|nr:hypothetical protein [Muriicola jejuensis]NER10395.1 hypothetical protein [Muriicola jejuensis]SMP00950.1 hypothetical protein SAMN06265375_10161 [Muriicola jejuensis]
MRYASTQYNYLALLLTLSAGIFFIRVYLSALAEPPSYNSGPNFLITSLMVITVGFLFSFVSLRILIDEHFLQIRMMFGLFRKKLVLGEISSVQIVRNPWYYGHGIRKWFWPRMWIYSVRGSHAIEISLKNGKKYRIGTNEPEMVKRSILQSTL